MTPLLTIYKPWLITYIYAPLFGIVLLIPLILLFNRKLNLFKKNPVILSFLFLFAMLFGIMLVRQEKVEVYDDHIASTGVVVVAPIKKTVNFNEVNQLRISCNRNYNGHSARISCGTNLVTHRGIENVVHDDYGYENMNLITSLLVQKMHLKCNGDTTITGDTMNVVCTN